MFDDMVPNPTSTKWSVKCSWWTKKECAGCVLRRIFPTCTSNLLLPCNVALTIQPKYMWDMYENTFCCLPFLVTFTFTYKNTLAFYSTAAIFRSSYKPHREDHPSIHSPTISKRERGRWLAANAATAAHSFVDLLRIYGWLRPSCT